MRVTIYGPNLPRSAGDEAFHVHATDCADTRRGIYPRLGADQGGWEVDVTSRQAAVEAVYSDQIYSDNAGDPEWGVWTAYESDLRFFPCTDILDREESG